MDEKQEILWDNHIYALGNQKQLIKNLGIEQMHCIEGIKIDTIQHELTAIIEYLCTKEEG